MRGYGRNNGAVAAADSGGLRPRNRPGGPRRAGFGNIVDDGISRRSADCREHRQTPLSDLSGAAKLAAGTNLPVRLTRRLTGDNYPRSQTRRSDYCGGPQTSASPRQAGTAAQRAAHRARPHGERHMAVPGPRLAPAGHDVGLTLGQACLGAELVGLVGALPGEGVTAAPEVAVGRRGLVDRPAQVQVAQDRARAQVEVLPD